jgi:hypothetical protein
MQLTLNIRESAGETTLELISIQDGLRLIRPVELIRVLAIAQNNLLLLCQGIPFMRLLIHLQ